MNGAADESILRKLVKIKTFRKYDDEDRYSSKHKKAKKHKYKDKDDGEPLLTEDQIKKEPIEST